MISFLHLHNKIQDPLRSTGALRLESLIANMSVCACLCSAECRPKKEKIGICMLTNVHALGKENCEWMSAEHSDQQERALHT